MRAAPPAGKPIVERVASSGTDARALSDGYFRRGYHFIGNSSFNSGRHESESAALQQGQKVGADLVLIMTPQHTGSETVIIPMSTPTTSTSFSTATATAYGSGGVVNACGSGVTTSYGTTTTMVPVTVRRTDYSAWYFIRRKYLFGVLWRDLNDQERQERQSNKGVVVRVIVEDSPAFRADILPGDIILAVNGEPVLSQRSLSDFLLARTGQLVSVSLYRRGRQIEKSVQLLN